MNLLPPSCSIHSRPAHRCRFPACCGLPLVSSLLAVAASQAGAQALNAQGTWGGLTIPAAGSIGEGNFGLSASDAREPQFGPRPRPRSYVLGVGLLPGLDFVGRFAEFATRPADGSFVGGNPRDGISDLSVNLKYTLPFWQHRSDLPQLAFGLQDVAGGGSRFRTGYVVGTQAWGPFGLTLGYGASRAETYVPGQQAALDGAFGGLAYRLGVPPPFGDLTLAAEYDGRQAALGARWTSAPVASLGGLRFNTALFRTAAGMGNAPAANTWTVGVLLPIGERERRLAAEPPTVVPPTVPEAVLQSPPAAMSRIKDRLVALGFERVRVGRLPDDGWALTYQNRRFGHNEVDALGVVLGEAAQGAPVSVQQLVVVALKADQPVLTVRADAAAWRRFLQEGNATEVRDGTRFQHGDGLSGVAVDWVTDRPSAGTWLQMQFTPEINYAVGTERRAFDYALAARVLATVPLWRGAQAMLAAQTLVDESENAKPNGALRELRQPNGVQALAVHQSLWLGRYALLGGAVGRYEYDAWGAEGEAEVFVPGRDDVLRLRGRRLEIKPDMPRGASLQQAASYRWVPTPSTWVEVGAQRFNDGSTGPTAVFTRWFGDVGTRLFYRRGGERKYAGIEFSFPLTPRAAPTNRWVQVSGSPSYTRGLRTRLLDDKTTHNFLEPRRVRDLQLTWDLDVQSLNAGRIGIEYLASQFPRMRQAYGLYATSP